MKFIITAPMVCFLLIFCLTTPANASPMPPFWQVIACEKDALDLFPKEQVNDASRRQYQYYCGLLKRHQTRYFEKIGNPMKQWRKIHVQDYPATVLYPFSGSDIITAIGLFPRAKRFVKLSLEHPGHLPKMAGLNLWRAISDLTRVSGFMVSLLEAGYEATRFLSTQDSRWNLIPGILGPSVYQLALRGMVCSEIQYLSIREDGSLLIRDLGEVDEKGGKREMAVLVKFGPRSDPKRYTFIHIRADLSDYALKSNSGVINYLKSLGRLTTLVKAASYLLHYQAFETIRQTIVTQSDFIIQDSTGVPLKALRKNGCWQIEPHGFYAPPPMPIVEKRIDPELTQLFKDQKEKLPFYFGYRRMSHTCDLVLARRRNCPK